MKEMVGMSEAIKKEDFGFVWNKCSPKMYRKFVAWKVRSIY